MSSEAKTYVKGKALEAAVFIEKQLDDLQLQDDSSSRKKVYSFAKKGVQRLEARLNRTSPQPGAVDTDAQAEAPKHSPAETPSSSTSASASSSTAAQPQRPSTSGTAAATGGDQSQAPSGSSTPSSTPSSSSSSKQQSQAAPQPSKPNGPPPEPSKPKVPVTQVCYSCQEPHFVSNMGQDVDAYLAGPHMKQLTDGRWVCELCSVWQCSCCGTISRSDEKAVVASWSQSWSCTKCEKKGDNCIDRDALYSKAHDSKLVHCKFCRDKMLRRALVDLQKPPAQPAAGSRPQGSGGSGWKSVMGRAALQTAVCETVRTAFEYV